MKLRLDKIVKIQRLEISEVIIIINYKVLKYSPDIAPEKLSERLRDVWRHRRDVDCTSRRCPITYHTFSVPVLSSSLQLFLSLHYYQPKCLIYCLFLNPMDGIMWMEKRSVERIKESVACSQNRRHCLYSCMHHVWCSAFQEGTHTVHAIIQRDFQFGRVISLTVNIQDMG